MVGQNQAGEEGGVSEFWYLVGQTRKFRMVPTILLPLLPGCLVVTGSARLAPKSNPVFETRLP